MSKLKFINHACFMVEHNGVKLLTDPWLQGNVFADGWALIAKDVKADDILKENVNAIVYTHEHPDHFSPSFLNIIKEQKNHILPYVIYQYTNDKKLVEYLRKIKLACVELKSKETYELAPGFEIKIYPYDKGDSVIEYVLKNFNGSSYTILNLNDCEFDDKRKLHDFINKNNIHKEPDILLTQFSYACWQSNGNNNGIRIDAAERKLNSIKEQIQILNPKKIVPFASYVYFCHQENESHNDSVNTPEKLLNFFKEIGYANFQFMKPLDTIEIGSPTDSKINSSSVNYWMDKYRLINTANKKPTKFQSEAEIFIAAKNYANKNELFLSERSWVGVYNKLTLPSIHVYIVDYSKYYKFHPLKGLNHCNQKVADCLLISSDAFFYAMKFDWGWESIHVAARFEVSSQNYYKTVMHALCLGIHRNFQTSTLNMGLRILKNFYKRIFNTRSLFF